MHEYWQYRSSGMVEICEASECSHNRFKHTIIFRQTIYCTVSAERSSIQVSIAGTHCPLGLLSSSTNPTWKCWFDIRISVTHRLVSFWLRAIFPTSTKPLPTPDRPHPMVSSAALPTAAAGSARAEFLSYRIRNFRSVRIS